MANYMIEKYVGKEKIPKKFDEKHDRYDWVLAWGFKKRTYPDVYNDEDAIKCFEKETARAKKCAYRLVSLVGGLRYSTKTKVIASKNTID